MILTDRQKDAITELINISFSRAAASLSELTSHRVVLEAPQVSIHPIGDLEKSLNGFFKGEIASVHQIFSGPVTGDAMLLLNYEGAVLLSYLLTGGTGGPSLSIRSGGLDRSRQYPPQRLPGDLRKHAQSPHHLFRPPAGTGFLGRAAPDLDHRPGGDPIRPGRLYPFFPQSEGDQRLSGHRFRGLFAGVVPRGRRQVGVGNWIIGTGSSEWRV